LGGRGGKAYIRRYFPMERAETKTVDTTIWNESGSVFLQNEEHPTHRGKVTYIHLHSLLFSVIRSFRERAEDVRFVR